MTTATNESQCATCKKSNAITRCIGCLQDFCFNHFVEHRQELNKQLEQIEQDRDLFQQTLNQQTTNPQNSLLIQQVDQWEQESIEKIKQTAQEIRETLVIHVHENLISVKDKMNQLTQQLKDSREQDNIIENNLNKWKEELHQITEHMNKPPNILIQQSQTALINKIQVQLSGK